MTSPTNLPYIPTGIIWDGVTEYNHFPPPELGYVSLLRMVGDGSRQFTEHRATSSVFTDLVFYTDRGWEIIGVTYENALDFLVDNPIAYLDYDGSLTTEPVNQIPYLQTYQRNAAVSAHDLQVTLGTDVMQSATADDYNTVKHSFIHLIGAAWQRYVEWAPVDPEELIIGGNYDGTPLWSRYLADHAATDDALCGTCDIANFARRFYFHANLPLFRRLHRSGIIYSVDRTANPWDARLFAVASQPESQYYDDLDTAYHEALRYYDERIGARLHQG